MFNHLHLNIAQIITMALIMFLTGAKDSNICMTHTVIGAKACLLAGELGHVQCSQKQ